jgi:hypothetical protein
MSLAMGSLDPKLKSMFMTPVKTDLSSKLVGLDHSTSGAYHLHCPPNHLFIDKLERNYVAPHAQNLTEELTPFMEEYYWRVDNGSQPDLFRAMFTPTSMYYNNCQKTIIHGVGEAEMFEKKAAGKLWMKHHMDKMAILPTFDNKDPVLVHVLGSHWHGPKTTTDREEQEKLKDKLPNMKFSQTFEIVTYQGEWKINRIILCMHDDIIGMLIARGGDPGIDI